MLIDTLTLLLWMAAYSSSWVLTEANILKEPRDWLLDINSKNILVIKLQQLLSCIYCTSFWCGILFFSHVSKNFIENIIYGFSTVTFVFLIERLLYVKE